MPLPQIPLDDPRVLALARARQQFAHDCTYLPTWEELTDKEREGALPDARNYLESAINAGLIPAVELIDSGQRVNLTNINDEIERRTTAMAGSAEDQKKARGELAQHAFETAGRVQLLAEHMEIVGWRIDGYSTDQLKELANLLRGTAIRAAMASDDAAIVSMVMGKPMKKLGPDENG